MRLPLNKILVGDAVTRLRELPADSVHCVVTSPPYWGLRDYGTGRWEGGNAECKHDNGGKGRDAWGKHIPSADALVCGGNRGGGLECVKCGARRVDMQIGLEPTPGEYVERLVAVFREVRRVLRPDGTFWLNMGDCFAAAGWSGGTGRSGLQGSTEHQDESKTARRSGPRCGMRSSFSDQRLPRHDRPHKAAPALKPKDLVGIPWRLALALQEDGWWLRMDNIWAKPNPLPESVLDRPTKSHEYVFLLAKSERYFYDADAVREPVPDWAELGAYDSGNKARKYREDSGGLRGTSRRQGFAVPWDFQGKGRNKLSVWSFSTNPFPLEKCRACGRFYDRRPEACACGEKDKWVAHFATFPEELPATCIKAGTSERGACAECGAPWERVVEKGEEVDVRGGERKQASVRVRQGSNGTLKTGKFRTRKSVGWRRTCAHRKATVTPCVVLDPFMGAGTTALVALKAGRGFVGVELNPEYAEIAHRRFAAELAQPKLL